MREALNLNIRYMETTRADLKQYIRNVTRAMFEDEICYMIHEVVNLLDVGVEEAWEIYADHPPPLRGLLGALQQD
jgi:hypothetical protein